MKPPVIDQLVYSHMFPKPKSTDPQNFQGLLQRQLVPEVRHETQAFYGHLSSQEAKYPGLDYSHQPHRNRLSRYPWHRRLFRAFDALRLTESEIAGLTKWEGTRWAKERFEKEQGVVIRDTTGDGIEDWIEPELRVSTAQRPQVEHGRDHEMEGTGNEGRGQESLAAEDEDMEDEDEDSDVEIRSVGIELNARLRAAVAEREAGNAATVMDEEWEQWLKEAVEAGGVPFPSSNLSPDANIPGTRPAISIRHTSAIPPELLPPQILNAARLGQWQNIPEFLHSAVRESMQVLRQSEESVQQPPAPTSNSSSNLSSSSSLRFNSGVLLPRINQFRSSSSTVPLDPRTAARLDHDYGRTLPWSPTGRVAGPRVPRRPLSETTP